MAVIIVFRYIRNTYIPSFDIQKSLSITLAESFFCHGSKTEQKVWQLFLMLVAKLFFTCCRRQKTWQTHLFSFPPLAQTFFSLGKKQCCQMVCFQTKNPNLGKYWRVSQ
jgi:hypothetical protein